MGFFATRIIEFSTTVDIGERAHRGWFSNELGVRVSGIAPSGSGHPADGGVAAAIE